MDSLIDQLRAKLAGDNRTDVEQLGPLAEAAFAGPEAVEVVLDGGEPPSPPDPGRSGQLAEAFLSSIGVEGFRGVGKRAELQLTPGPGLTLVIGRNGSGKSSFAEGFEMLLTGANLRWAERTQIWKDGWRNLHQPDDTSLDAELRLDGHDEPTLLRRSWAGDASLDQSDTELTLPGGMADTIDWLEWGPALDNYRPFLSYNELGSMLTNSPSNMHDAMSAFLGLDYGVAATEVLRKQRLALERPAKDLKTATQHLRRQLEQADDQRAASALGLLNERKPPLDRLAALVDGATGDEGELGSLRELAHLALPDRQHLEAAAGDLGTAVTALTDAATTDAGYASSLATLLRHARDHWHQRPGEATCPVCGTDGVLGEAWAATLDKRMEELETRAATATALANRLGRSRRAALAALAPVPGALRSNPDVEGVAQAIEAWEAWVEAPATDADLVARLRSFGPVAELAATAANAAGDLVEQHDLRWRPHAQAIAGWLEKSTEAEQASERAKQVKAAEDWMKAALGQIRDERFEPIARRSRQLWEVLRHRSNVQLEQVALEGQATRRRVSLEVTVDGVPATALGVMSQGELHGLALSLFLPRATMDDSPFRFVVIDDPVQAMDPAKVEGLARVLEEVASQRQVIVFTHDNRLPEAVRYLGIEAEHIEVTRQAGSVVSTKPTWDPVTTALDDARAIAKTKSMDLDVRRKIVPTFCRLALEAAATIAVWRRRGFGHDLGDLVKGSKSKLNPLLALAVVDDEDRVDDMKRELKASYGPEGPQVLYDCNAGSHGQFTGDPEELVRATKGLAKWLRARR